MDSAQQKNAVISAAATSDATQDVPGRFIATQLKRRSFRRALQSICEGAPDHVWLKLWQPPHNTEHTHGELLQRVVDFCTFYRSIGIQPGDTVLIILKESLDLYASFFAGIVVGALPAYFAYPSPKQAIAQFLNSVTDLTAYNDVRTVIAFRDVTEILQRESSIVNEAFLGSFDANDVPPANQHDLCGIADPQDEAFLQFSSGTTGAKKGVKISFESLSNQLAAYRPHVGMDASSKIVSWLPHYHDMGLIACMLMPFLEQVPVTMMSPFDWVKRPDMLLQAITEERATHVWLPNFALGHLTRHIGNDQLENYDLSSLRHLVCCSEPVLHETVSTFVNKFSKCGLSDSMLSNCYAMAENTFAMTVSHEGGIKFLDIDGRVLRREHRVQPSERGERIASVGAPLANVQIQILDDDQRPCPCQEDVVGEIALFSDCMLDSYHNNEPATNEAFTNNGWFKTGDLGFIHDGDLYVTGRKKDLIIVGGENVYPQDIELILNQDQRLIPGRNVVFGVDDARIGTERIVVLAEAEAENLSADTANLRAQILNRMNVSVSDIILLPRQTLRKGTAGKISRHLNKLDYCEGKYSARSNVQDAVTLEVAIRTAIPSHHNCILGQDTSLVRSGLIDSFGFVELVHAIEKTAGIEIPQDLWTVEHFDSIDAIQRMLASLWQGSRPESPASTHDASRRQSLERLKSSPRAVGHAPFWESVINHCPLRGSMIYGLLLRCAGVQVGRNVTFLGRIHVKLRGKSANIVIGDNVVLGDRVDLRNRENGRIFLHEASYLDQNVRIVAARDGKIEVGYGTEIGANTVINSGGSTTIGQYTMIAANVQINSSRHGTARQAYIKEQPHEHGEIKIGDDVWIGAGAAILPNTWIRNGAVISSNTLVTGEIPQFAICAGVPARVLKYRS